MQDPWKKLMEPLSHQSSRSSLSSRRSTSATEADDPAGLRESTAATALILGILPGLLNFFFGQVAAWTELCVFISVAIWLYWSLRVPWDKFLTAQSHGLSTQERYYLVLVFGAPLIGSYMMAVLKEYYQDGLIIGNFDIPLFLLGSFLRPLMHFLSMVHASPPAKSTGKDPELKELAEAVRQLEVRLGALESRVILLKNPTGPPSSSLSSKSIQDIDVFFEEKIGQVDKRLVQLETILKGRFRKRNDAPKSIVLNFIMTSIRVVLWPWSVVYNKIFN